MELLDGLTWNYPITIIYNFPHTLSYIHYTLLYVHYAFIGEGLSVHVVSAFLEYRWNCSGALLMQ